MSGLLLTLAALAAPAVPPVANFTPPPAPLGRVAPITPPTIGGEAARSRACAEGMRRLTPSVRADRSDRSAYTSCMGLAASTAPDVPLPVYRNPRPVISPVPLPAKVQEALSASKADLSTTGVPATSP